MKTATLPALMISQLRDIYDAESRLVKALPKMARMATAPKLREAFENHLDETRHQVERLEKVFELLGASAKRKSCEAMKGLIEEAKELADEVEDPQVRDAALIAAAQKVEHYEIATYGTLIAWARREDHPDVVQLLEATLREEKNADTLLTALAEGQVATGDGVDQTRPINERAQKEQ
jgi:ferritin-like metal-binding protein YciE